MCGSREISYDMFYAVMGEALQKYSCKVCGYKGSVIVEDGSLAEKLRAEWEGKKPNRQ